MTTVKHVDVVKENLEDVTLESDIYCIPTVASDPLFDLFAIVYDTTTNTFTISTFPGHDLERP